MNTLQHSIAVHLSCADDMARVEADLQSQLPHFFAATKLVSRWYRDDAYFEMSEQFPAQLWWDDLAQNALGSRAFYVALQAISMDSEGRILVEYPHPDHPHNPYYSLLFDCGVITLVDDSEWESTGCLKIITSPYPLPT